MLSEKVFLIAAQFRKILLYEMSYFPEPYSHNKNNIKPELDLSKARTADLKMQEVLTHHNSLKRLIQLALNQILLN